MQGHGRIIAPDFCVAHREANSGLSTLNRTKSILSIYHQQRQLQKQRGMCLNDTYPFCQQPLSGNCHSICFSKPVLWTATTCGKAVWKDALLLLLTFFQKLLRRCAEELCKRNEVRRAWIGCAALPLGDRLPADAQRLRHQLSRNLSNGQLPRPKNRSGRGRFGNVIDMRFRR